MIKQEHKEINGVKYNVCPICQEVIVYPFGVYFRSGIEVHPKCIAVARMRRGKINKIDY